MKTKSELINETISDINDVFNVVNNNIKKELLEKAQVASSKVLKELDQNSERSGIRSEKEDKNEVPPETREKVKEIEKTEQATSNPETIEQTTDEIILDMDDVVASINGTTVPSDNSTASSENELDGITQEEEQEFDDKFLGMLGEASKNIFGDKPMKKNYKNEVKNLIKKVKNSKQTILEQAEEEELELDAIETDESLESDVVEDAETVDEIEDGVKGAASMATEIQNKGIDETLANAEDEVVLSADDANLVGDYVKTSAEELGVDDQLEPSIDDEVIEDDIDEDDDVIEDDEISDKQIEDSIVEAYKQIKGVKNTNELKNDVIRNLTREVASLRETVKQLKTKKAPKPTKTASKLHEQVNSQRSSLAQKASQQKKRLAEAVKPQTEHSNPFESSPVLNLVEASWKKNLDGE